MLFEWSNPESWPSNFGSNPYVDEPVDQTLVNLFLSQYKKVRVFHSCRTDCIASYLEHGIKISTYAELDSYLVTLAKVELNLEIPKEILQEVSSALGNSHEGSCFVVIDKNWLLQNAAHYSIYGSERLLALVTQLQNAGVQISREVLTRRGTPAVFSIDLELNDLSMQQISSLVSAINNHVYDDNISAPLDFTFRLRHSIPPDKIVSHVHPSVLRDPMNQYKDYKIDS